MRHDECEKVDGKVAEHDSNHRQKPVVRLDHVSADTQHVKQ